MLSDEFIAKLEWALNVPEAGCRTERDGSRLYVYLQDGSMFRLDVRTVAGVPA